MNRWDFINNIIKVKNYSSYLEIGVDKGTNFDLIEISSKESVDPGVPATYRVTSDSFFKNNDKKYDIIFIDGLHKKEQLIKDIINSLKILNPIGCIVCHDCNPDAEYRLGLNWSGTCWEAIAFLRASNKDLFICTVDVERGFGFIRPGVQSLIHKSLLDRSDFKWLEKNRKTLLNTMSYDNFLKIL